MRRRPDPGLGNAVCAAFTCRHTSPRSCGLRAPEDQSARGFEAPPFPARCCARSRSSWPRWRKLLVCLLRPPPSRLGDAHAVGGRPRLGRPRAGRRVRGDAQRRPPARSRRGGPLRADRAGRSDGGRRGVRFGGQTIPAEGVVVQHPGDARTLGHPRLTAVPRRRTCSFRAPRTPRPRTPRHTLTSRLLVADVFLASTLRRTAQPRGLRTTHPSPAPPSLRQPSPTSRPRFGGGRCSVGCITPTSPPPRRPPGPCRPTASRARRPVPVGTEMGSSAAAPGQAGG
jgi:hypothetical protein